MRPHAERERSAQPRHDPLRFVAGTGSLENALGRLTGHSDVG